MAAVAMDELLKLDLDTRLAIIEALWNSIVDSEHVVPLSEADRDELDRRLVAYRNDPGAGASWSDVRERIFRRG